MPTHYQVIDYILELARSHRVRSLEYSGRHPGLFHDLVHDHDGQDESAMDQGNQASKKTCVFVGNGDLSKQCHIKRYWPLTEYEFFHTYLLVA